MTHSVAHNDLKTMIDEVFDKHYYDMFGILHCPANRCRSQTIGSPGRSPISIHCDVLPEL